MSVGYKLYREVRDYAPSDWTPGELLIAWIIADDARDDTRQSWIPLEELCRRARMRHSGVREALSKLAGRGFEFRIVHGYGKDGRPVFATRGHAVDYLVPDLKGAAVTAALSLLPAEKGAAVTAEGAAVTAPIGQKGAAVTAPLPSKNYLTIPSGSEAAAVTPPVEGNGHGGAPRQPHFDYFTRNSYAR